jgi:hypothetical protein
LTYIISFVSCAAYNIALAGYCTQRLRNWAKSARTFASPTILTSKLAVLKQMLISVTLWADFALALLHGRTRLYCFAALLRFKSGIPCSMSYIAMHLRETLTFPPLFEGHYAAPIFMVAAKLRATSVLC